MKIKYLFALSILLSLLLPRAAYAQAGFSEYFITVDPDSGTIHLIKEIPQVHWIYVGLSATCVDQARGRYMFHGIDSAEAEHFYTLDAATGTVLYAPVVTVPSGDNWGELQYDDSLQRLFGIYWRAAEQLEYFISIDQVTGAFTFIDTIDGVNAIPVGLYSYDQHHHAYILNANQNLYTIDARTGAVLSSPILRTSLGGMHFDNATGTLYGNIAGTLMKIDPATADTTVINQIPWCQGTSGTTMDEIHQRYITLGDSAGDHQIISLDTFGVPVSHPRFFQGQVSGENAVELCYDNTGSKLYGLHWHYDPTTGIPPVSSDARLRCYPNPSDGSVTFNISPSLTDADISLYNMNGQIVTTEPVAGKTELTMSLHDLPKGIYHYEIKNKERQLSAGNLILQ